MEPLFRSDDLQGFQDLLSQIAAFEPLYRKIIRVEVVIDASMVQRELRWRLRGRKKPDARSAMQEAIEAGTLVIFAPTWLRHEIGKHIRDIAADAEVPEQSAVEEWCKFAEHIHFYQPEISTTTNYTECVDPDDLPYKLLRQQLGADAVYSSDPHFDRMGEPRINVRIDMLCRDYARAASVEAGLTLGSGFTVMVSLEALSAFIQSCIRTFKRLPPFAKVGLIALGILTVIHPAFRKKIAGAIRSVGLQFTQPNSLLAGLVGELVRQFVTAKRNALKSGAAIKALLPPRRRRSAIAHARAVCLVHKAPLLLGEIEGKMRDEGYVSKSPHFRRYLLRLLRSDKRFKEVSPNLWTFQAEIPRTAN